MAEEKKDAKKDEKPSGLNKSAEQMIFEILLIALGLYFLGRLFGFWGAGGSGSVSASGGFSFSKLFSQFLANFGLTNLFNSTVSLYTFLASLLSMLFILGIIYALIRMYALEKIWTEMINPAPDAALAEKAKNPRWERVIAHINSDNTSDWRLAILECDIILDEVLDKESYIGNTIGDKLKSANPGDFRTLNNAWEAHRIRNAIAHEGQDFALTQREARRIVGLYETVFREFDAI